MKETKRTDDCETVTCDLNPLAKEMVVGGGNASLTYYVVDWCETHKRMVGFEYRGDLKVVPE